MDKKAGGNLLIAQGGGPTVVINSSLAGIIERFLKKGIEGGSKVFGAIHGVEGVLNSDIIDLSKISLQQLIALRKTPGAFLGSCRKKLVAADYDKILRTLMQYNVRYFVYIGGNDSMDTANKIYQLSTSKNYELKVIGVPKTVDNDLPHTDHCPGYGSASRYIALTVREIGLDIDALPPPVTVIETMGRNSGWIAAAAGLAKLEDGDAPNLIYFPEKKVGENKILSDIEKIYLKYKKAVVVVSEGLKNDKGEYLGAKDSTNSIDDFGHRLPGGASSYLASLVSKHLKLRARNEKPGIIGRTSFLYVSKVDLEEAYEIGKTAVDFAFGSENGVMVTLKRCGGEEYKSSVGCIGIGEVANNERLLPDEFINGEENFITEKFVKYCQPLIGGKIPAYFRLRNFVRNE
jgi:6-phosphofructokinase 1